MAHSINITGHAILNQSRYGTEPRELQETDAKGCEGYFEIHGTKFHIFTLSFF